MTYPPGTKRIIITFDDKQNDEIEHLLDRLQPLGWNRSGFRVAMARKGMELAMRYYSEVADHVEQEQAGATKRK